MKCPGQDTRYWEPGAIFETECPNCGKEVEFFKDDTTRKCRNCGHGLANPKMDFGCISYCKFATQCTGDLPPELLAHREDILRDRVVVEIKRYFKDDFKRIDHAARVARYAEIIVKAERGDTAVVLSAAYLHDIGIKRAEQTYNSTASEYQEKEGPPVARAILEQLGAGEELIEEACDIISHHHHPRKEETVNFRCLYDADLIANLEESIREKPVEPERLTAMFNTHFLTVAGKELANKVLLD
ncbi:MAG: HD domain-containing protein [Deltaproteobacteria bacterium]|nr:HD domain-containing protein [Deltaproteobacteria bacterium]